MGTIYDSHSQRRCKKTFLILHPRHQRSTESTQSPQSFDTGLPWFITVLHKLFSQDQQCCNYDIYLHHHIMQKCSNFQLHMYSQKRYKSMLKVLLMKSWSKQERGNRTFTPCPGHSPPGQLPPSSLTTQENRPLLPHVHDGVNWNNSDMCWRVTVITIIINNKIIINNTRRALM